MSPSFRPSITWLFAFIPISVALDHGEASAPLVFFSAALAIIPIARMIVHATETTFREDGRCRRRTAERHLWQRARIDHRVRGIEVWLPRHGPGVADRRDPCQPVVNARYFVSAWRNALPRPAFQRRGRANLQHDDAAGGREHGRAECFQPLLRAGRHDPAGTAAQRRHRRRAAARVRSVSVVFSQDPSGGLRQCGNRSRWATTRERNGARACGRHLSRCIGPGGLDERDSRRCSRRHGSGPGHVTNLCWYRVPCNRWRHRRSRFCRGDGAQEQGRPDDWHRTRQLHSDCAICGPSVGVDQLFHLARNHWIWLLAALRSARCFWE